MAEKEEVRRTSKDLWFQMHHTADPSREAFAVNCYLDESATDGGTPDAVVGGVLLNQSRFEFLDSQWREMLVRHQIEPALHMKDFGRDGKHAHFSDSQRAAIFVDAVKIINQSKIYSVAATLSTHQYKVNMPAERQGDMSIYGMCFILAAYMNHLLAKRNGYTKDVAFVMDEGNPYALHVFGAHAAMRQWRKSDPLLIGSLTFDDDEDILALQAADVVAWAVRRRAVNAEFKIGFEPLLGIFDEAHSENAWTDDMLKQFAERLDVIRDQIAALKR